MRTLLQLRAQDTTTLPLLNSTMQLLVEAMQGPYKPAVGAMVELKGIAAAGRIVTWSPLDLGTRGVDEGDPALAAVQGAAARVMRAALEGPLDPPTHAAVAGALDFSALPARIGRLYAAAARRYARRGVGGGWGGGRLDVRALPLDAFDGGELARGFDLFLLCAQLADGDASRALASAVGGAAYAPADRRAYWFFQKNAGRVEVVRDGRLERVYFPRPLLTNYLTRPSRDHFVWSVDRASAQSKLDGLLAACGACVQPRA